ncbi:conserved domain protein [delta proteobacterium NaphS2]|nr:conserved domain protein [delta proteobacterium NaphS2]
MALVHPYDVMDSAKLGKSIRHLQPQGGFAPLGRGLAPPSDEDA